MNAANISLWLALLIQFGLGLAVYRANSRNHANHEERHRILVLHPETREHAEPQPIAGIARADFAPPSIQKLLHGFHVVREPAVFIKSRNFQLLLAGFWS